MLYNNEISDGERRVRKLSTWCRPTCPVVLGVLYPYRCTDGSPPPCQISLHRCNVSPLRGKNPQNRPLINQNLRSRFGIERHPYTKSHIGQIPCVCMYVCMCNYYSQTTEPICIKIIPNRAFDANCYGLLRFEIFTPTIFITPKTPKKSRE